MSLNLPLQNWTGRTVWLIGASSGIGRALASALHARGAQVIVSARNAAALNSFVLQHPGAQALALDASDAAAVKKTASELLASTELHCVVYCAGYYQAMSAASLDLAGLLLHDDINYRGALHVLAAVLPHWLQRAHASSNRGMPHPHISLVGSVAGYRGLPKSLAYGPTKAALINLAETLYLDLQPHGIGVSLINPGFVDTALTANNTFTMPALLSAQQAAQEILRGWARGQFEIHFPKRFTLGLKLLQLLPYRAYFALTRRLTR